MTRRSHLRRAPEAKHPLLLLRAVHCAFTSAPFPFRQHRVLFVVLCIHICAVLLGHSADVKAQNDNDKRTPLLLRLRDGYVDLTHIVLRHGADAEARDKRDESPLEWASTLRRIRQRVRKTIVSKERLTSRPHQLPIGSHPPESRWSKRAGLHVVHCGPPFLSLH